MTDLLFEDQALKPPAGNPKRFGARWRLVEAGLSNVWRYGDLILPALSGRLLLRGPNGTGKTTALEALWPFLLDLNKTKLRAGQARTTTLTALMKEGQQEAKRIGYAWLTLAGPGGEGVHSYGVRLEFSNGGTPPVRVVPFTIPGRPVKDLPLVSGPARTPITTTNEFCESVEHVGGTVFDNDADYVTDLGNHIFGADRDTLIALADRIRRVRNPALLANTNPQEAESALREALPAVDPDIVEAVGEALAAADETRQVLDRDQQSANLLATFAEAWGGYAAKVVGDQAEQAQQDRQALRDAQTNAKKTQLILEQAQSAHENAERRQTEATRLLAAAQSAVSAIERSPAYQDIGRIADFRQTAAAKQSEAQARADALVEAAKAVCANANDLRQDAERLSIDVADVSAAATRADPSAEAISVRVSVSQQPNITVDENSFHTGDAVELIGYPEQLTQVAGAWKICVGHHDATSAAITLVLSEHKKVVAAEQAADSQKGLSEQAQESAAKAADSRDRAVAAENDEADAVAAQIQEWAKANRELTMDDDNASLTDETITTALQNGGILFIDAANDWSARATRRAESIACEREALANRQEMDAQTLVEMAEQHERNANELRSGKTLPTPRPAWSGDGPTSLGEALIWVGETGLVHRHVESALAATGILGATLTDDGASTNAWRVDTSVPLATQSLNTLVGVDRDHPLAVTAAEVLKRIWLTDRATDAPDEATTVIGRDGSFRLGVITGRSPGTDDPADLPELAYIGEAQRRAAADAEATRLETLAKNLREQNAQLISSAGSSRNAAHDIRQRAKGYPSLTGLYKLEQQRAALDASAHQLEEQARKAAAAAAAAKNAAQKAYQAWCNMAAQMSFPADIGQLEEMRDLESKTAKELQDAANDMQALHDRLMTLQGRAERERQNRAGLDSLHAAAVASSTEARSAAQELKHLESELGQEANKAERRLAEAQESVKRERAAESAAKSLVVNTQDAMTKAQIAASLAKQAVVDRESPAQASLAILKALAEVPDVAEISALPGDITDQQLVNQTLSWSANIPERSRRVVADVYEETRAKLSGIWAVNRGQGYEDQLDTYVCTYDGISYTPRSAAEYAIRTADRARDRLQEVEEQALRDFILGRLPAAIGAAWVGLNDWVKAVNRKMTTASASSGVGVQVKIHLREDLSAAQTTVYELACKKAAVARTTEENERLAEALKGLLAASTDETTTERVRQAVDIRDWLRVEYFIQRPGQDPKRWTSRTTGLSGGERRLVILAPMLASIAALYDSLPRTTLRLAALDEVPAEVDEHGREGLARFIGELDLDLICTSYLWDGAPGVWDGIDAYDFEAEGDVVVAFPMLIRGLDALPDDAKVVR